MHLPAPLNRVQTMTSLARPQAATAPGRVLMVRNPAAIPQLAAAVAAHRAQMLADAAFTAPAVLP